MGQLRANDINFTDLCRQREINLQKEAVIQDKDAALQERDAVIQDRETALQARDRAVEQHV